MSKDVDRDPAASLGSIRTQRATMAQGQVYAIPHGVRIDAVVNMVIIRMRSGDDAEQIFRMLCDVCSGQSDVVRVASEPVPFTATAFEQ